MKIQKIFFLTILMGTICTLFQGCRRNSNDVWEDTKSAGRHMKRGVMALGGQHNNSRQIRSRGDFECIEDNACYPDSNFQDCEYQDNCTPQNNYRYSEDRYANQQANDFIPINDPSNELNMADMVSRPPRETPGESGSSIPGIQSFFDPSTIYELAGIFRPIYFDYDSSLVKGQQNMQIVHAIVDFLQSHSNVSVFIEGHTDERGPQAYNLALGSRRANAVRNLFISEGIHPDRLFTIFYGKERPAVLERQEESLSKNRRAEFKIYER